VCAPQVWVGNVKLYNRVQLSTQKYSPSIQVVYNSTVYLYIKCIVCVCVPMSCVLRSTVHLYKLRILLQYICKCYVCVCVLFIWVFFFFLMDGVLLELCNANDKLLELDNLREYKKHGPFGCSQRKLGICHIFPILFISNDASEQTFKLDTRNICILRCNPTWSL
jgi:hypothetical protein